MIRPRNIFRGLIIGCAVCFLEKRLNIKIRCFGQVNGSAFNTDNWSGKELLIEHDNICASSVREENAVVLVCIGNALQEGQNILRMILLKTFDFKVRNYLERTKPGPVGSCGGHCVVYVCNGNDLRKIIDFTVL